MLLGDFLWICFSWKDVLGSTFRILANSLSGVEGCTWPLIGRYFGTKCGGSDLGVQIHAYSSHVLTLCCFGSS